MIQSNPPVLVALMPGKYGQIALREAYRLAVGWQSPLHIVHVLPRSLFHCETLKIAGTFTAIGGVGIIEMAKEMLQRLVSTVLPVSVGKPPLHIVQGTSYEGILRVIDEISPSIVVLGGASLKDRPFLGGTSELVVRYAPCTVLIAHRRISGPMLAATDFSDPSLPAIAFARATAEKFDYPLSIIHVIETAQVISFSPDRITPSAFNYNASKAYFDSISAQLEKCAKDFGAAHLLREGRASQEVIKAVKALRASALVIGTHGKTGWKRITLGSVAEDILCNANCSIFVVRLNQEDNECSTLRIN